MAGHSKWANIKHRKGAQDKRRGKLFTRLMREVSMAAREGLPDPAANPRLRLAIQNAKGANIPKDTITRAIEKASGKESTAYVEPTYEGYGPGGVAIFVECATDNLNRTVQDVRMVFNKYGGNLGTNGSLAFLFERMGIFIIPADNRAEDDFILELIDAGANDVELADDKFIASVSFENFGEFQRKLEQLGVEAENATLQRIPHETVILDEETARKALKLIESLEDLDDVQEVFHNLELSEDSENE